jgi:hypothetical protein
MRIGAQQHAVDAVLQQHRACANSTAASVHGLIGDDAAGRRANARAVFVDAGLRVLHVAADASRREALAAALRDRGITTRSPSESTG